ncbi:hypothetical protein SAMN05216466_109107 [Paraburkholderia phenazinium]|jgi:hypothetical protein|uniref:Uncharacterized protein n=1 Tax=Paraburkholderia phenazinium TaxID=60549 RepID=A0A1G8BNG2_9BURK|nr:hypothetical protein SAMN05216466_109107 [Paraburkholderia phenazinium]
MTPSSIGANQATPTSQPSTSSASEPTASNQNATTPSPTPTGNATLGQLAILRRSNSMENVHSPERGVSSAMRVSIQVGQGEPQVEYSAAYLNRGVANGGVLRHDTYDTLNPESGGTQVGGIHPNDEGRRARSPARLPDGRRAADTAKSMHDAEVHMLSDGVPRARRLMAGAERTAPWQVQVEYHGNFGPCGQSEDVGCKGRLAKSSKTLESQFLEKAPPGSTFKAMSVYTSYQDTTRGQNPSVPTRYGYPGIRPNMKYGEENHDYNVRAHTILDTSKPAASGAAATNASTSNSASSSTSNASANAATSSATASSPAAGSSANTSNAPANAATNAPKPSWANIAAGKKPAG